MSDINSEINFDLEDIDNGSINIGDILGGVGQIDSSLDKVTEEREYLYNNDLSDKISNEKISIERGGAPVSSLEKDSDNNSRESDSDNNTSNIEENNVIEKEEVSAAENSFQESYNDLDIDGVAGVTVLVPYIMYFSVSNSEEVVGVPGFIDVENRRFITFEGKDFSEEIKSEKAKKEIYSFVDQYCKMIEVQQKSQEENSSKK